MLAKASYLQALGGSSLELPPERRYLRKRDLYLQALGGSSQELPPREAIFANATFTYKHSGARAKNSPREMLSSQTRLLLTSDGKRVLILFKPRWLPQVQGE